MRSTFGGLCLSWALALGYPLSQGANHNGTRDAWHHLGTPAPLNDTEVLQRCADEEGFDAVTLDERGTMLFFKGDSVWKGFTGPAEPINASWPKIRGPVDAALRLHHTDHPEAHDNIYLFQGKQVWAFAQGKLRQGYPRPIEQEFKGVPGDLDAAVECHPTECSDEAVLFFKGPEVLSYNLRTQDLKRRSWPAVASCSAALRWLDRHYCFRGIHFWRFDPVMGHVPPRYPLDVRDYFMRCPGRGHVSQLPRNATLWADVNRCSGRPFQAFSSDDSGRIFAFRGGWYFRVDSARDGWHPWPLGHNWKGLEGEVAAAFSWEDKLYLVQGSQVTIYRAGAGYSRVEGYPRALQDELGVAGADAAFTCPHSQDLYVIQGSQMRRVDLLQSPRRPGPALTIPHGHVDSALCTTEGTYLFEGANVHRYADVAALRSATAPAPGQDAAAAFFECPAAGGGAHGAPQHPPRRG